MNKEALLREIDRIVDASPLPSTPKELRNIILHSMHFGMRLALEVRYPSETQHVLESILRQEKKP